MNFQHDKWAVRVLKAKGEIYLTDWSTDDYCDPEIEVTKLLPEGSIKVGVLGKEGIFDVTDLSDEIRVIEIAGWSEIEVLPEWGAQ